MPHLSFWMHAKMRIKMAWAILRGRSVMFRMEVTNSGVYAQNEPGFIVQNHFHGTPGNGINFDRFLKR